jgi:hypothetical protein
MTVNMKTLWDALVVELKNSPGALGDPEVMQRFDTVMAPVDELKKTFQRERDHQPFVSQAPCPICGGTVTYRYQAPLIGSMKCDTVECISFNL